MVGRSINKRRSEETQPSHCGRDLLGLKKTADMTELTRNDVIEIVRTLNDLIDDTSRFMNEFGGEPTPNSPAIAELKTFERAQSVMTALSQGVLLSEVAADQLMTLVRSLTEPVQTISPWTCLRAILESSALAVWFLEPNIGVRMRVQRSFAFRFEGLEQQRKWMRIAHASKLEKVKSRINSVEQVAVSLGYDRIIDRNKKLIGLGQVMPSVTEIIKDTFDEEATYRLLSAIAHGHHWALTQLGFRLMDENQENNSNWTKVADSTHALEKNLEPNMAGYVCLKAVIAFTKSFWCMCRYCGWWNERTENMFDQAYDRMNIRTELRCWRAA